MKPKTANFLFNSLKLFLRKRIAISFIVITLCFLIFLSNKLKHFKVLRSYTNQIVHTTLVPINKSFNFINKSQDLIHNLINHQDIIQNLKKELYHAQSLNDKYTNYVAENIKLKQLLNFVQDKPYQFITARLIGLTPGPFVRTASIAAGYTDGVDINNIVVNDYGVVGKIIEVDKHQAKVLLLTDYNSRVPVITAISRQLAIISGDGSKILLNYINETDKLIDGELILTSGDGMFYPPTIPVARVVIKEKKVHVELLTNYIENEYLSVLKIKQQSG